MKSVILACALILIAFAVDASAQCPGGRCPTQRTIISVPVTVDAQSVPATAEKATEIPAIERRHNRRASLKAVATAPFRLFLRRR
jgi:hypothetical protein